MSELNNKKDKIFLVVLIDLIMAILITTFAIIFHQKNGIGIIEYFSKENSLKNYENNNEVIEETSEKEEIDFNDIKRVNLSDTFIGSTLPFTKKLINDSFIILVSIPNI